jgi:uncharacterized phage protein (TIGR01671 family)
MRDIKFRGKTSEGKWEYGGVVINPRGQWFITTFISGNDVEPETVGQYTGLKDMNGKEIYEGDIVKRTSGLIGDKYEDFVGIVKFECASFNLESLDGKDGIYLWDDVQYIEVLGNIYENPQLLKECEG